MQPSINTGSVRRQCCHQMAPSWTSSTRRMVLLTSSLVMLTRLLLTRWWCGARRGRCLTIVNHCPALPAIFINSFSITAPRWSRVSSPCLLPLQLLLIGTISLLPPLSDNRWHHSLLIILITSFSSTSRPLLLGRQHWWAVDNSWQPE